MTTHTRVVHAKIFSIKETFVNMLTGKCFLRTVYQICIFKHNQYTCAETTVKPNAQEVSDSILLKASINSIPSSICRYRTLCCL